MMLVFYIDIQTEHRMFENMGATKGYECHTLLKGMLCFLERFRISQGVLPIARGRLEILLKVIMKTDDKKDNL